MRTKNPSHVDLVLSNLVHGGKDRLQVVSDFDRTISLHSYNGQPCPTSNGKFKNSIKKRQIIIILPRFLAVLEMSRFVQPEIREKV